ncbi:hypothetical protein Aperf_G00000064187 [Anoplocephala perfoliata]
MKDLLSSINSHAVPPTPIQNPTSRILSLPTPKLPVEDCAIISPAIIWSNELSLFLHDEIDLSERLNYDDVQEVMDVLFGLPRRHLSTSEMQFRSLPVVNAFATTIVLRDFYPEYIHKLRERLMEAFPGSRFIEQTENKGYFTTTTSPTTSGGDASDSADADPDVFVVHYRGHNLFMQYAPPVAVYTCLVLYICFSVSKINMVKSKFGLAISACFSIFASFVMTLSLCVTLGLMSPALRGREFFPYLVVLIGFEKLLTVTKAVVGTPIDIPVKYRVAQGLAVEGWPMTKNLLLAFFFTTLGFFTFNSDIQEFCLTAIISYTTDFFLQMFFFVPVLAIDIHRMELSDLENYVIVSSKEMPTKVGSSDKSSTSGLFDNNSNATFRSRGAPSQPSEYHRRSMSPTLQNCPGLWGHRRVRSDATSAPFVASERQTRCVGARRRFRVFLCTRRRFIQCIIIALVIPCLVVMSWKLFVSSATADQHPVQSSIPPSSQNPESIFKSSQKEPFGDNYRQIFGLRAINRNGFGVRWNVDSLWRHMAFSAWPAIADRYNFSLAGRRLVVFEPIHVVQLFSPELAIRARPPTNTAAGESRADSTTNVEFPRATLSVNSEDGEFDGDRTWWSHELAFGHKEALAALGLTWSGFLVSWTAQLWVTAKMAGVSLLGAGFFLSITMLCMLLIHRRLSRSNPDACREPVVRVRQLSIPLLNRPHNIQEWVIAHSDRELFYNSAGIGISLWGDGILNNPQIGLRSRYRGKEVNQSLIAVTVSGYFGGPNLMRSIRLWSADRGFLVGTIDRFYQGSFEIRAAASQHRDLQRRFSPIWSMKVHPPTGSLIAGCANGTMEIWDLKTFVLRQLIDLTSPEFFYDAGGALINNGSDPVRIGGVTVIETSLENHYVFYFGTSMGFVGCVKWGLPTKPSQPSPSSIGSCLDMDPTASPGPPPHPQWNVHAKWAAHPNNHAVALIALQRVFPGPSRNRPLPRSASFEMRYHLRSCLSPRGEDLALVSGALGGSLALIQPQRLRFQRFQWDSIAINCADFFQLILIIFRITLTLSNGYGVERYKPFLALSLKVGSFKPSTVVFGQNSGRVRMLSLAAAVPLTSDDLRVEMSDLCTIDASGRELKKSLGGEENIEDSTGSPSWIRVFRTSAPSSTEIFRMVTYCRVGAVSVWSIHATGCHLVRWFSANAPAFAIPAPIICVDDRVIFGERGYLRLVNPRTAKYERSAQLMPPILPLANNHQHAATRQADPRTYQNSESWERGLGPLGITTSSDGRQQLLCGLSDSGRTIFIVPKSALLN